MTVSDRLIEVIQTAAEIEKVELADGRILTTRPLHSIPSRSFLKGASFKTLKAFAEYCKNTAPGIQGISTSAYIHVVSPTLVKLVEPEYVDEASTVQDVYAVADATDYLTYRNSGEYQTQTNTVIRLMTRFYETEERQSLIKLVSSLADSDVATSEDDGISQTVTVKTGVVRKSKADVKPTWYLAPIRTFLDVEQPESLFLCRIKSYNQIALYEADCNLWVVDAIAKVCDYLKAQDLDYPIYG